MKINKTNYESYFLDYHEGTLDAENSAELFLFLEQHPELKEEFESFEMMFLSDDDATTFYPDKESLKRKTIPDADTIQEWLIAEMEGDLNLQERSALLSFLAQHPQFQTDRDLYSKTIIHADLSEKYPNKSALRKRTIGTPVNLRVYYAIAASLILLIGAWTILKFMTSKQHIETADKGIDTLQQIIPVPSEDKKAVENKNLANENPAPLNNEKAATKGQVVPNSSEQNQHPKQRNLANQDTGNKNKKSSIKTTIRRTPVVNTIPSEAIALNNTAPKEAIALLSPRSTPLLNEPEPFVFAERRYVPGIEQKDNNLANLQPEIILNDIKEKAASSVNKVTGEELLAANGQAPKLPVKSRIIQFAAWSLNKVSGNRIKLKTEFNPNSGKLSAYVLEVGKKKWQRITDF